jgi:hypothetical protein
VVIRAQRKVRRSRRRAHQQRLRSKLRHSYYGFLYISAVRVVSIPTPYVTIYIICASNLSPRQGAGPGGGGVKCCAMPISNKIIFCVKKTILYAGWSNLHIFLVTLSL